MRNRITRGKGIALAAAFALVLTACSSNGADETTTTAAATETTAAATETTAAATETTAAATETTAAAQDDMVIGLSLNSRASAIFVALAQYLVDYSAEYGEEIGRNITVIETVADDDPTRQNADIDDLISQG
ncbi:MAG: hypothetical protein ABFR89_11605, partial [Actinomycetota bacterium]